MNIKNVIAAAGLTLSIAAFAPPVFAQAPGGTMSSNPTLQSAPAAGAPGTEAPSSAAPVGAASNDFMSSEHGHPSHESLTPQQALHKETEASRLQVQTGRDIAAARAQGMNVAKAQHQRWLGSMALSKGDRQMAINHFHKAERELRAAGYTASAMNNNRVKTNESRQNLNAEETGQMPNAANTHPNSAATTY